jgi:hypothetical protein
VQGASPPARSKKFEDPLTESPIFVKTQAFLVWLIERTERFRKSQRFVMARRLQDDILNFMDCLIEAARSREPLRDLRQADVHLEKLRRHIRICVELKLITLKQYEFAAENLAELGKLLGGWMSSIRKGRRSDNQATGSEPLK